MIPFKLRTEKKLSVEEFEHLLLNNLQLNLSIAENSIGELAFIKQAVLGYQYYAGKQDSNAVLERLKFLKRPDLVFNEIKPKINLLIGVASEITSIPRPIPIEKSDEALAQLIDGVLRYQRHKTSMARIEKECFSHCVKCGKSYLHIYLDKRMDKFNPQIKLKALSGLDIHVDPESVNYDLSDANYIYADWWFSEDQIQNSWPKFSDKVLDLPLGGGNLEETNWYRKHDRSFRVVECWYWEYEPTVWFKGISGKIERTSASIWPKIAEFLKSRGVTPVKIEEGSSKILRFAIFSGQSLLEYGVAPVGMDMFPYIQFGAYKDDDINSWQSVVGSMIDPQKGLNSMRRQLLHLLMTAPKPMLMFETGSVLNMKEYKTKSSDPNFALELTNSALTQGKVKFSNQPQISALYSNMDSVFSESIKFSSGIQNELLGIQTTSREPGVSVQLRQQAASNTLTILFDNYRDSRVQAMKLLTYFVQKYVSPEEIARVMGEGGIQLMNLSTQNYQDITTAELDFMIDDRSEGISQRLAIAKMLTELEQAHPGSIPPEVIMEYTNLPLTAKQQVIDARQQSQQAQQDQTHEELDLKWAGLAVKLKIGLNKLKEFMSNSRRGNKNV